MQQSPEPAIIQRKPAEGNDLTSPRFAGEPLLEACFNDRARITRGHRGSPVQKVQQALVDLGYNLGAAGADGFYGQKTWDAVKQFKANEGLGFERWEMLGRNNAPPGRTVQLENGESPTKVADEESIGACPSDGDIVTKSWKHAQTKSKPSSA